MKEGLISTLIMLGHKIKTGRSPSTRSSPRPAHDPGHPAELNQVWTNLIDNALQAMPDGGTLTDPHRAARTTACWSRSATPAPASRRSCSDKIFEPFFTTKPVGEGTGLGLDICYRVITQRHGGDLRVVSVPGDTRFQVRLPLRGPATTDGPPTGRRPGGTALSVVEHSVRRRKT